MIFQTVCVCVCNIYHIDIAVSFMESTYSVSENGGAIVVELVLTKPSSTDITVQVMNVDVTAIGGK